jgi:hypothetical protein
MLENPTIYYDTSSLRICDLAILQKHGLLFNFTLSISIFSMIVRLLKASSFFKTKKP